MARHVPLSAEAYSVGGTIGYTSSGLPSVAQGTIEATGQIVAIKRISLEALCEDQDKFERLQRTLQLETQLLHPTILNHYAAITVGDPEPALWIVSPLMEHGSVAEILLSVPTRGLEEIVVAHIIREVLKALEYLHSLRIMMRVVCAQSVFVAADCSIRLGGFEHALSFRDRERVHDAIVAPDHISWIAPEVLRQDLRGYTSSADIYSLATCAFEVAFGVKPFDDLEVPRVFLMKMMNEFPSLPQGHHMPLSFVEFVCQCISAPHARPTATRLLSHPFTTQVRRTPPALYHLCTSLPPLPERAARIAALRRQNPSTYDPTFLQPHLSRIAFPQLAVGGLTYARPPDGHAASTHGLGALTEEDAAGAGGQMVKGAATGERPRHTSDGWIDVDELPQGPPSPPLQPVLPSAQPDSAQRDRVAFASDGCEELGDGALDACQAGLLVEDMVGLRVGRDPHGGSHSSL